MDCKNLHLAAFASGVCKKRKFPRPPFSFMIKAHSKNQNIDHWILVQLVVCCGVVVLPVENLVSIRGRESININQPWVAHKAKAWRYLQDLHLNHLHLMQRFQKKVVVGAPLSWARAKRSNHPRYITTSFTD